MTQLMSVDPVEIVEELKTERPCVPTEEHVPQWAKDLIAKVDELHYKTIVRPMFAGEILEARIAADRAIQFQTQSEVRASRNMSTYPQKP